MKPLVHCLWLALAACGGSEHTTTPPPRLDAQTLQKAVAVPPVQKAADGCPPPGTAPDGPVPLACLDLKAGGS